MYGFTDVDDSQPNVWKSNEDAGVSVDPENYGSDRERRALRENVRWRLVGASACLLVSRCDLTSASRESLFSGVPNR
jgi:hypothetical protein